jgi:hypothetical protein
VQHRSREDRDRARIHPGAVAPTSPDIASVTRKLLYSLDLRRTAAVAVRPSFRSFPSRSNEDPASSAGLPASPRSLKEFDTHEP